MWRTLRRDDLFQKGALMFFASVITGIVNLLFRVVMGRMMTVEEFGEFNAIFALTFYISHILIRTIRTSTADLISHRIAKREAPIMTDGFSRYLRTMALIGASCSVIFLLLASPIQAFLKLDSIWLVISTVPFLVLSWVLPVNLGVFQGVERFLPLAASMVLEAVVKLVTAGIFVAIGLGAIGAMLGVGMGSMIGFLFSSIVILLLFRVVMSTPKDTKGTEDRGGTQVDLEGVGPFVSPRELATVSSHILIAILSLAILTNIDVVLVKHFFTSEDTGLYSAALVLGRILYFLPIGFTMVMYPKMVRSYAEGTDRHRILGKGIIYISLPTLALTLGLLLFPSLPLGFLMGDRYSDASNFVGLYATLMFIFSFITVLVYYFLAERMYNVIYLFASFSVLQIVVAWFYHPDLQTVIWIFIWFNLTFLLIASSIIIASMRSRDCGRRLVGHRPPLDGGTEHLDIVNKIPRD